MYLSQISEKFVITYSK